MISISAGATVLPTLAEVPLLAAAPRHASTYCELHNNRPKTAETSAIRVARKSQKRFRDTPRFQFQAVLARPQPFLSRSVEKRGDQSRFKCRNMVKCYAIRSMHAPTHRPAAARDSAVQPPQGSVSGQVVVVSGIGGLCACSAPACTHVVSSSSSGTSSQQLGACAITHTHTHTNTHRLWRSVVEGAAHHSPMTLHAACRLLQQAKSKEFAIAQERTARTAAGDA